MRLYIKRFVDIFISVLALIAILPLLVLLGILILVFMGYPIIFSQVRPGYEGKLFKMYKFRTMTIEKDTDGKPLPDKDRLTRLGIFLRSSSLDELPELINVLIGDMSLVGPRPLLNQYLPIYTPEQARRHEVKPGITGWAQINGRNTISWEEKFALDVWYVDNWSIGLDMKILFLTVWKVLKRDGISAEGEATMSEFIGSSDIQKAYREASVAKDEDLKEKICKS